MKRVVCTTALLSLTVAAAGAQAVVGRADATWSTREDLRSGERLHLTSPNGTITIAQGTGSQVEVQVEKRADRGARFEDVGFVVKRSATGLTVCAVYDDDDECDMERGYRGQRRRNRGWNSPRANFTVRIPAGVLVQAETGNGDVTINGAGSEVSVNSGNGRVRITSTTGRVVAHTGNGDITVDGARGAVDANTGNGNVRVATSSGPVTARSGNGDIDVSMDRVERASGMSFSTGSGRIVLAMPGDFGAELEGSTGNGHISSELPIRIEGRIETNHMRGTIGRGGERLEVSTGNGDIEIRKSR
jgi:hypothetical protein